MIWVNVDNSLYSVPQTFIEKMVTLLYNVNCVNKFKIFVKFRLVLYTKFGCLTSKC